MALEVVAPAAAGRSGAGGRSEVATPYQWQPQRKKYSPKISLWTLPATAALSSNLQAGFGVISAELSGVFSLRTHPV